MSTLDHSLCKLFERLLRDPLLCKRKKLEICNRVVKETTVCQTITHVCEGITSLRLMFLFTADVKDAFHLVPINRDQIKYNGIQICGLLFFWTTLVFGLASSCADKLSRNVKDIDFDLAPASAPCSKMASK